MLHSFENKLESFLLQLQMHPLCRVLSLILFRILLNNKKLYMYYGRIVVKQTKTFFLFIYFSDVFVPWAMKGSVVKSMQMTVSEIDVKTMQHVRVQIRKSDGLTYHNHTD